MNERNNKIRGSLIGGAIGDALGYQIEFKRNIKDKEITKYQDDKGIISDDTQMCLFTANALLWRETRGSLRGIAPLPARAIYEAYLDWLDTQNNTSNHNSISWIKGIPELNIARAPGNTCLSSLASGKMGTIEEPINNSKGCGGIMRVAPVGLYAKDSITAGKIGAESSAITHGHPLGILPCYILASMLNMIVYNNETIEVALDKSVHQYYDEFNKFNKEDVDYLIELINKAKKLSKDNISDVEAISSLGEGWVAEETFAIAIYSCLKYPNSFKDAIICSINHDGDSDSTGAVAGNIVGAYLGYDAIPDYYKDNVELKNIILELADDMSVDVPISEYSSNKDEKWENKYLYCKYIKDKKDTKKTLERNSLSELYGYHSKKNINDEDSTLEYINKIDSILSSYSFVSDENFMLLGRKKFIYDEICEILNESKTVDNPLSFVLGSLEEFICNNNFVYMSDSEHWEKGWEDLRNRNDMYSQKNIICLEEKNIIEDIINKIKSYIENKKNSDNNKLTKSYYKQRETDTIWWVENPDTIGEHLFTFDKERVFNLFKDYPHALTPEQKKIFDKENPYWADYFKDRQ